MRTTCLLLVSLLLAACGGAGPLLGGIAAEGSAALLIGAAK